MPAGPTVKKNPAISKEAVQAKTGKTWTQWFALIDKAGGRKMNHKEIVACLSEKHGVGAWWRQMVAVEYERSRGLREKYQKAAGYSAGRSKTMNAGVKEIFAAWQNPKVRNKWLGEKNFTLRTATPNKSLRMIWKDGKSQVNVNFYSINESKTRVVIEHNKLADAVTVKRMQNYWSGKLENLRELLGG